MTLDPPHEEPPGIGKGVLSVPGEARVAARRGSRPPVVDQGGIVVALRRVQARERGERLGVRRLEPGGEVEQDDGGVLLALLPRGEAAVYRLGPDLRAVAPDVVRALGLQGEGARERAVRSAGVAHLEVVAAKIVPGGRVLLLEIGRASCRERV